jgi:2'-5' RNA ligase
VARVAADLRPALTGFERIREDHSILLKRLGHYDPADVAPLADRLRRALRGTGPVAAQVTGVDFFEAPPSGSAPVVYLTVESPGLYAIHHHLVETFGAIDGLEGEDYTIHVTLARDGDETMARRLAEREIDPVTWTVGELRLYDATHGERVRRLSLPVR